MQYSLGGKSIVCSHNPGIETIVRHEENGLVVPIDSLPQMAVRLVELLCDDEKRARFAEQSLMIEIDLSRWGTDVMILSTDKICQRIAGTGRGYDKLPA